MIEPKFKTINALNSEQLTVGLQTGSLVIFPSTLLHSVPANGSGQERVSIAFNMMFSHFAETIAPPKWEGIRLQGQS